jgi:hypothetical protein
VGRVAIAGALGAALLMAAAACSSTSSGVGSTDAAAEAAGVSDDAQGGAAGDDDSGAAACAAVGGQCEVGAFCEEVALVACGPVGSVCCLHVLCAADAKVQLIQASDYDQSCIVDSDCVEVYVGNACSCEIGCRSAMGPINKAAEPQYTADLANGPQVACSCAPPPPVSEGAEPVEPVVCCVGGQCETAAGHCAVSTDAAADTGADAATADAGADAALDGGTADADACAPSGGCTAACVAGRHNVSTIVDGCPVTECCVPDDASAD